MEIVCPGWGTYKQTYPAVIAGGVCKRCSGAAGERRRGGAKGAARAARRAPPREALLWGRARLAARGPRAVKMQQGECARLLTADAQWRG
jgi:hypothetical protein